MKFLKKFLFLIISIVALVLIVALFVKKEYHVSRSIEINASKSLVFDYIRYLKNQEDYAVWQAKDPDVIQSYSGIDGKVGVIYSWESKLEDVGVGEQEITQIDKNNRVDFELRFMKPMEMTGDAYMTTKGDEEHTTVTWGFKGRSPWPWNIFFLFMDMDKELGPDLDKGLQNLKKIMESD